MKQKIILAFQRVVDKPTLKIQGNVSNANSVMYLIKIENAGPAIVFSLIQLCGHALDAKADIL